MRCHGSPQCVPGRTTVAVPVGSHSVFTVTSREHGPETTVQPVRKMALQKQPAAVPRTIANAIDRDIASRVWSISKVPPAESIGAVLVQLLEVKGVGRRVADVAVAVRGARRFDELLHDLAPV